MLLSNKCEEAKYRLTRLQRYTDDSTERLYETKYKKRGEKLHRKENAHWFTKAEYFKDSFRLHGPDSRGAAIREARTA